MKCLALDIGEEVHSQQMDEPEDQEPDAMFEPGPPRDRSQVPPQPRRRRRRALEWQDQELGALLGGALVYRHFANRVATERQNGEPGPAAVYNKLYWSEYQTRLFEAGMGLLGGRLEQPVDDLDPRISSWEREYWYSRAARIFAGSNEIQRNIIAERVLGLPR